MATAESWCAQRGGEFLSQLIDQVQKEQETTYNMKRCVSKHVTCFIGGREHQGEFCFRQTLDSDWRLNRTTGQTKRWLGSSSDYTWLPGEREKFTWTSFLPVLQRFLLSFMHKSALSFVRLFIWVCLWYNSASRHASLSAEVNAVYFRWLRKMSRWGLFFAAE